MAKADHSAALDQRRRGVLTIFAGGMFFAATLTAGSVFAADKPLLGMVPIAANEPMSMRYQAGATAAAKELGWTASVVDASGSADQANAAIQNFASLGATAIVDMVFPYSSIGAGMAAAKDAGVPVVSWGGGLGNGMMAANGSGLTSGQPVIDKLIADMGGEGELLELTFRAGAVGRDREIALDKALAKYPKIKVTKNEVRIPGYFEDGAQYANAWLASRPAGGPTKLAIWACWDDPALGAIGALRQQGRTDVLVYGVNGNAQAIESIKKGFMTATSWQNAYEEGYQMVKMLPEIKAAGANWKPKNIDVPAVLVDKDNVDDFLKQHPDAAGTK